MSWRLILVLAALSLLAEPSLAATKNVVLVVADDLSLDVGCYGNRAIKTPNIDRLAADATLFTHAFCTTASCSPSRSVLLSGMHNHANGTYGLEHSTHHFHSFDKVKSLPVRLWKSGYRTARVGKYHVAPEAVYHFDLVLPGNPRNGVQMAENARDFIAADDKRPFFLYFCTTDPHRSGKVGPPPYKPNRFGNENTYPGVTETRYDPKDVIVPPFLPDTPTSRAELAEYYQSVSRFDAGVGRLIEILKASGHWDDTLLVLLSDNGMPFPAAKTTTYEAGLRLPCIVRNPYGKSRPARSSAMISFVDIAPTILDFAGAPASGPDLHGRSFLSILEEPDPTGWDEVYASHTFHEVTMYYPMRAVRHAEVQADLESRLPVALPVRLRLVGIGDLAGGPGRGARRSLRQADGGDVRAAAGVRAVRPRPGPQRSPQPGRRPAPRRDAGRVEGQAQKLPKTNRRSLAAQMGPGVSLILTADQGGHPRAHAPGSPRGWCDCGSFMSGTTNQQAAVDSAPIATSRSKAAAPPRDSSQRS